MPGLPLHTLRPRTTTLPLALQTNPEVFGKLLLGDDLSSARSNSPGAAGRLGAANAGRGTTAASVTGGKSLSSSGAVNRGTSLATGARRAHRRRFE